MRRSRILVQGVVQGVGFRPFVYQLAHSLGLVGKIANSSRGVEIDLEGRSSHLEEFGNRLAREAPPLSSITAIESELLSFSGEFQSLSIIKSQDCEEHSALIPPDAAICSACLEELCDDTDRRYRYPFINCTHCGPRYTIVQGIPYDRPRTSMAEFRMCEACQAEYDNPLDRRFHAQPNACPDCGPRVWLCDSLGTALVSTDPLRDAARRIWEGQIIAFKGVGGFHLICDARNAAAVTRLRKWKGRSEKPLAVLCRDINEVRELAWVSSKEQEVLLSRERPIVLLRKKSPFPLVAGIAPANAYVGVMLPYAPIHVVLLQDSPLSIVATSANLRDDPILVENEDALSSLREIADLFVLHDRGIVARADDSVVQVQEQGIVFVRRSRGYVPRSIHLSGNAGCSIGVGAQQKSTICVVKGNNAVVGAHIGDHGTEATFAAFEQSVEHLERLLGTRCEVVGCDLHPDYESTRYAQASGRRVVSVQHHHAHVVSCMAENGLSEPVLGLALDGTGLGDDGTLWGGELLWADFLGYKRVGHLYQVPMPGGDQAVREPYRMAIAWLRAAYPDSYQEVVRELFLDLGNDKFRGIVGALQSGFNCPVTSSMGRLFDAVAAMCGLFPVVSYEAQAAIALESMAEGRARPVEIGQEGKVLDGRQLVRQVVESRRAGASTATIAWDFHLHLAGMLGHWCDEGRKATGGGKVVLTGGVFQNRLLRELLRAELTRRKFEVFEHHQVPCNDGGISLGQAVVAVRAPG